MQHASDPLTTSHQDVDAAEVADDLLYDGVDILPLAEVRRVRPGNLACPLLLLVHLGGGLLVRLGGDVDAGQQAAMASEGQRQRTAQAPGSARQLHTPGGRVA